MKKSLKPWLAALAGPVLAALFCTWSLSLSIFNTYGIFSKRYALILGLLFVLFSALFYWLLARAIRPAWHEARFRHLFFAAAAIALITGLAVAYAASRTAPYRVYFLPDHRLKVSLPTDHSGQELRINWIHTGLVKLGDKQMRLIGSWEKSEKYLLATNQPGALVSWSGPAVDRLSIALQSDSPGVRVMLSLDGQAQTVILEDTQEKTIEFKTPITPFDRLLGIAILGSAIAIGLLALLALGQAIKGLSAPHFPLSQGRAVTLTLTLIGAGFLTIHLVNNILPWLNLTSYRGTEPIRIFTTQSMLPVMKPVGADFREGVYVPSKKLVRSTNIFDPSIVAHSIYPPLINVLGVPYVLFSEDTAYGINVIVLYLANIACLVIGAFLVYKYVLPQAALEKEPARLVTVALFMMLCFYVFNNNYTFLFSIERGNLDILALLLALLALACLLVAPEKIWLQVILLSIAVHIKIYPAILFAPLFFKHRWKTVVPGLIVNIALLLVLGPANALTFLQNITRVGGSPYVWIGNHSGYAIATLIANYSNSQTSPAPGAPTALLTFLPIIIWLPALLVLWFRKYNPLTVIWSLLISIPVMDLFPTTSHDYKIVIENVAFLILLAVLTASFIRRQKWSGLLQILLVLVIMGLVGRSYEAIPAQNFLLANKYLPLLAFEILIFVNLLRAPVVERNASVEQHASIILPEPMPGKPG